ncbi:MAG: 30S ribosomal protein S3 [Elusimicrobia bacterium]|nr:30S ribosomal protein S3 [Elusimicrobiota bacterium]
MGQKVSPTVLRIGINKNWRSVWFADRKDFSKNILEDHKIRKYIKEKFAQGAVSCVEIERLADQIKVRIASARPGVIIGRRGADIDRLRTDLGKISDKQINVEIKEIKNAAIDATLVAQGIAFQMEKRVGFRRAMKRAVEQTIQAGAKGVKVIVSGRLDGAEIARREKYHVGKIPLQTFRADIDYGFAEAITTYGCIGVKVWVYKGDTLKDAPQQA